MTNTADLEQSLRAESANLLEMAGSEAFTIHQRRMFETLGNKLRVSADALSSLSRRLEEARAVGPCTGEVLTKNPPVCVYWNSLRREVRAAIDLIRALKPEQACFKLEQALLSTAQTE